MQKILVPTEFTYLSKCALTLGLEMAKIANAKIDIVSVIAPNYNEFMGKGSQFSHDPTSSLKNIQITEEARKRMHERAEEIAEWFPDQKILPKILYGNKVDSLVNEIHQESIDLVVMGGDLYDPKDDTANEFLKHSTSPVLVLKCMIHKLEEFKDIIFLADVEHDSEKLIYRLKELQNLLDATIHILRVNTPKNFLSPKKCNESLENFANRNVLRKTNLVSLDAKTEVEGLMNYCEEIPNAFVCLGIHERSFLQSLITNKNKELEIIANSIHPVWTYRD